VKFKSNSVSSFSIFQQIQFTFNFLNYFLSSDSINLHFFNKTESDIWLQDKFEDLQKKDTRFKVKHILSEPNLTSWTGQSGRITKEIIETAAKESEFAFICGPRIFNDVTLQLVQDSKLDNHCFQG
jgi:cytochrome-b5 reductase